MVTVRHRCFAHRQRTCIENPSVRSKKTISAFLESLRHVPRERVTYLYDRESSLSFLGFGTKATRLCCV